jgi:protein bicaudal D
MGSDMDAEQLRQEITRISRELDQTQSEKVQAAQYGMGLLEENSKLNARVEELSEAYELMKNELEVTKDALDKVSQTHKITEKSGIQHEESLLSENAALECSLNSQIVDLEVEVRMSKQELGKFIAIPTSGVHNLCV